MENTIFKFRKVNDIVNIEFDVIGKYIERIMDSNLNQKVRLSEHKLREAGY